MIYQAWCAFSGQPVRHRLADFAPEAGCEQIRLSPAAPVDWQLQRALRWIYDVRDDDARLRAMLARVDSPAAIAAGFDRLRKEYPLRRENTCLRLDLPAGADTSPWQAAGFSLGIAQGD